jgi:hypothetical protein
MYWKAKDDSFVLFLVQFYISDRHLNEAFTFPIHPIHLKARVVISYLPRCSPLPQAASDS